MAESGVENIVNIVLVEDNEDLSQTVQAFLSQAGDFALQGAASCEKDFKRLIEAHLPHIALVDIGLDTPRSGLDLLEWLAAHYPVVRPVIMTVNRGDVLEAYQRGARGYVLKSDLEQLAPTLREVSRGQVIIPPGVGELMVQQMTTQTAHYRKSLQLLQMSEREREILALLNQDMDREAIADRLRISYFTVRRHVQNILEKTGEGSIRNVLKKFGEVLGGKGPNRGYKAP